MECLGVHSRDGRPPEARPYVSLRTARSRFHLHVSPIVRRAVTTVTALTLAVGVNLALGGDASASPVPTAKTVGGLSMVGALFPSDQSSSHFCSASVVSTHAGNVIVTAAHCIQGDPKGEVFVPGYNRGAEPYGSWQITGAYTSPVWLRAQDPQHDYAFLTVADKNIAGLDVTLQSVTGGMHVSTAPANGETVTVAGYNTGTDTAQSCTTRVEWQGAYPSFRCANYLDGSSGSPWMAQGPHGLEVVGVIGGLNQGGCDASISYSSAFKGDVHLDEHKATGHHTGETLPNPNSDGCP